MIISNSGEKAFDKLIYPFMTKKTNKTKTKLRKLEQRKCPQLIKEHKEHQ